MDRGENNVNVRESDKETWREYCERKGVSPDQNDLTFMVKCDKCDKRVRTDKFDDHEKREGHRPI